MATSTDGTNSYWTEREVGRRYLRAACESFASETDGLHLDDHSWNLMRQAILQLLDGCDGPKWRSPLDKPAHLPDEHHSEDVLLAMMDSWDRKPICRIGHVSLGHWRPNGGNGNFDKDVLGWMPLPDASDATRENK